MMQRIIPPCGDCERKGCGAFHDECEPYLAYKAAIKERKGFLQQKSIINKMPANARIRQAKLDRLK